MPRSRRWTSLSWALLLMVAADTTLALSMRKFNIDGGSKQLRPNSNAAPSTSRLLSSQETASASASSSSSGSSESSQAASEESSASAGPSAPRSKAASLESVWPGDSLELTSQEQEKQIYESFTRPQEEPALALLPAPGSKNYVKLNPSDPFNIHGREGPSASMAFPVNEEPVRSREGRPKFVPKVHPPVVKRPPVPERFWNPKPPKKAVSVEEAGTPPMSEVFGAVPPPPGAPTREPEPKRADDHEDDHDHHEEAREEAHDNTESREQPRGEDQPKEQPQPQQQKQEERAEPKKDEQEPDGVNDLGKVPNLDTIHPERAASGSDDSEEDAGPHGDDSEGENGGQQQQQQEQVQVRQAQPQPQPQEQKEEPRAQPQPQPQPQPQQEAPTSYQEGPSQSSTEALAPAKNPLSGADTSEGSSGDDAPASLFGTGSSGGQDPESSVLAGQSLEDQPVEDA